MKYFIDTEFLEGTQDKTIFGIKYGQTKPTIDLISIALVGEDGREYYAVSKDFNLKEAWNRYDEVLNKLPAHNTKLQSDVLLARHTAGFKKVYWIRENVLKPIALDLFKLHCKANAGFKHIEGKGDYKSFKWLLEKYGKTNKQIAKEIKEFICPVDSRFDGHAGWYSFEYTLEKDKPEFYGYYSDYDWVAFCWLFGRMIDLPKGFPMYCIDLKQELDRIQQYKVGNLKDFFSYPKQTNEHNALANARWNCKLYKFLESL